MQPVRSVSQDPANEADAKKESLEKQLGVKVSRSVAKAHKTAEDCIAANLEK